MMPGTWEHQVELKLDRHSAGERLRRAEAWCADWQIGFRVLGTTDAGTVRMAFEDARFARAFHSHFGGVIVPDNEPEMAFAADAADNDLFDRLVGEYPE